MSTLSSANVTDVILVLTECSHMRLCISMLIFTHNLVNSLIEKQMEITVLYFFVDHDMSVWLADWTSVWFTVCRLPSPVVLGGLYWILGR